MSRVSEYDGEEGMPEAMWEHNVRLALAGKRGQAALWNLRAALLALPEKRLIANALRTVGLDPAAEAWGDLEPSPGLYSLPRRQHILDSLTGEYSELLKAQGEGVCAVGAYCWWMKMRREHLSGDEAFAALPVLADFDAGIWQTVEEGRKAGLTRTLAWVLADLNDESLGTLTPEDRYIYVLAWIERRLAGSPAFPGDA